MNCNLAAGAGQPRLRAVPCRVLLCRAAAVVFPAGQWEPRLIDIESGDGGCTYATRGPARIHAWGPETADSPRGSLSRSCSCSSSSSSRPELDCLPPVRDPPRPQEGSDRIAGGCGKTGDWRLELRKPRQTRESGHAGNGLAAAAANREMLALHWPLVTKEPTFHWGPGGKAAMSALISYSKSISKVGLTHLPMVPYPGDLLSRTASSSIAVGCPGQYRRVNGCTINHVCLARGCRPRGLGVSKNNSNSRA